MLQNALSYQMLALRPQKEMLQQNVTIVWINMKKWMLQNLSSQCYCTKTHKKLMSKYSKVPDTQRTAT